MARHKPYIPLYKRLLDPTISQQSNLHYKCREIWIFCSPLDHISNFCWWWWSVAGLLNGHIHFHKEEWKVGSNGSMQWKLENQFQGNLQSVARGVGKRQAWRSLMRYALSWASCIFWCHKALGEIIVLEGSLYLYYTILYLCFCFLGVNFRIMTIQNKKKPMQINVFFVNFLPNFLEIIFY